MLGKTFKGMTDEMLAWQTAKLRKLAIASDAYTVHVEPRLVVEVAFNDIEASPRYPDGSPCASPGSSATGPTSGRGRRHDRDRPFDLSAATDHRPAAPLMCTARLRTSTPSRRNRATTWSYTSRSVANSPA